MSRTMLALFLGLLAAITSVGDDTVALQARIDSLAEGGGGTLSLTAGVYRSGALFFRPGVNLHLDEGALLKGVDEPESYPMCETRIEGETCIYFPALINADGCDGFHVTGKGIIDGHGLPTWQDFWKMEANCRKRGESVVNKAPGLVRPRLLYVANSRNVDVSGVVFRNSKFWTTHYYRCENLFIHDCRIEAQPVEGIRGPSTDAIDLDVVRQVVVSNVVMDVDDDAVVLKGGKGLFADDPAKCPGNGPNSNVLVVDCRFGPLCHHCLTLGSECVKSEDVTLRDCRVDGAGVLLYFKMRPDTPQSYLNVTVARVSGDVGTVLRLKPWTQYNVLAADEAARPSYVDGITLADIRMTCDRFFDVVRSTDYDVRRIFLHDLDIRCRKSTDWDRTVAEDMSVRNVRVSWSNARAQRNAVLEDNESQALDSQ